MTVPPPSDHSTVTFREAVLAYVEAHDAAPVVPWDESKGWREQDYSEVEAGLRAAFPLLLREFLDSDAARDVTGKWGHTTKTGDEFRADLYAVLEGEAS